MVPFLAVMLALALDLLALGALAHISLLLHHGNLKGAASTSVVAAFCILVIGFALGKARAWLDGA